MLHQITVTDPRTGNPMNVELRSHDEGKTWFLRPESVLQARKRVTKIAFLSEREKSWLDLVELPSGADIRSAVRMSSYSGGGE